MLDPATVADHTATALRFQHDETDLIRCHQVGETLVQIIPPTGRSMAGTDGSKPEYQGYLPGNRRRGSWRQRLRVGLSGTVTIRK